MGVERRHLCINSSISSSVKKDIVGLVEEWQENVTSKGYFKKRTILMCVSFVL